jgi:surface antigen
MKINKFTIGLGIAVGLLLVPASVAAVATPPAPKPCSRHEQAPVAKGMCATYNYARGILAEVNALAARLTGQEAKTAKLEAKTTVQEQKLIALEKKIAELEKKLDSQTPTPDPCHGYPANLCNAPLDSVIDPWGLYNRESVSWVAYRISASGRTMPYGFGNAKEWPAKAQALGVSVNTTPKVGDAAISTVGQYGHAAYVEELLEGGTKVRLSQFNATLTGEYSETTRAATGLTYIHF